MLLFISKKLVHLFQSVFNKILIEMYVCSLIVGATLLFSIINQLLLVFR